MRMRRCSNITWVLVMEEPALSETIQKKHSTVESQEQTKGADPANSETRKRWLLCSFLLVIIVVVDTLLAFPIIAYYVDFSGSEVRVHCACVLYCRSVHAACITVSVPCQGECVCARVCVCA